MLLFCYFSINELSNCYLLGSARDGEAVLIDPGTFDAGLLKLIEDHRFDLRTILVTHTHAGHIGGIKTILKIYPAEVFCFDPQLLDAPSSELRGGDRRRVGTLEFSVLETPGHSSDSLCFACEGMVFTGDALTAGAVGTTGSTYERSLLVSSLRQSILTLPDSTLIFPGHGPPTTVGVERTVNPDLLKDSP